MVRPCVARGFVELAMSGLASMYPAFDLELDGAPGHHGEQRACELFSGQASAGHLGHQGSHAPGRPDLHLVSSSRKPRQAISGRLHHGAFPFRPGDQTAWAVAIALASKPRPRARTLQAMRASLLASAIASTLWCSRLLAASIQGLSPYRSQFFGLSKTTQAAWTNSARR